MPQGNPEAYLQQPQGSPDAHLQFRSLPREQQYALLSRYTGTSNANTLSYAANIARSDPHMASRVMEQLAAGGDVLQPLDDSIGGNIQNNVQSQVRPPQGPAAIPQGAPNSGVIDPNAIGNGQAQLPASAAPTMHGPITQPQSQSVQPPGADVASSSPGGGVGGDSSDGMSMMEMLLLGGGGVAAVGGAAAGIERMTRGRQANPTQMVDPSTGQPIDAGAETRTSFAPSNEFGSEVLRPRNVTTTTEADIGSVIDANDALVDGGQMQANARGTIQGTDYIPRPPASVGNFVVADDGMIIDIQSRQPADRQTAVQVVTALQEYLQSGDTRVLQPLMQGSFALAEVEDALDIDPQRLQAALQNSAAMYAPQRGAAPVDAGRTLGRSAASLF